MLIAHTSNVLHTSNTLTLTRLELLFGCRCTEACGGADPAGRDHANGAIPDKKHALHVVEHDGQCREPFPPRIGSRTLMDCLRPFSAVACGSLLLLTCALLVTSSYFEGVLRAGTSHHSRFRCVRALCLVCGAVQSAASTRCAYAHMHTHLLSAADLCGSVRC